MKNPKISVIMSTYKEPENYLRKSIESILNQTFRDFEFIIILDNPSNKEHERIIKEYIKKDKRVIFFKNERNLGRGASKNKAIYFAKGKYIAIMDADDIALPERLEKQFNFLEENEDVDLLFTWAYWIDEKDNIIKRFTPERYKVKNIEKYFFKEHLFMHPSMMAKAEVLKKMKYNKYLLSSEDYDFWIRCILNNYKFDILEEYLLKYRFPKGKIEDRIKKHKEHSKYDLLILWNYRKYFYKNIYFWKRFFNCLFFFTFFTILPQSIIKLLIKMKDKNRWQS